MEFKEDPERMDELRLIIDDIVANAQKQAELKIDNKVKINNTFGIVIAKLIYYRLSLGRMAEVRLFCCIV